MKSTVENTGSPIDPSRRAGSPVLPATFTSLRFLFCNRSTGEPPKTLLSFLLFSRRLNLKIPNLNCVIGECVYLLAYLLTYSTVQSPSWAPNWFAASQEIPRTSRHPKVHYRTHKRPPPASILDQPNPVHIPTSHLLEIHSNIIHPSTPRSSQTSLSLRFPHQDPIHPPLCLQRCKISRHWNIQIFFWDM